MNLQETPSGQNSSSSDSQTDSSTAETHDETPEMAETQKVESVVKAIATALGSSVLAKWFQEGGSEIILRHESFAVGWEGQNVEYAGFVQEAGQIGFVFRDGGFASNKTFTGSGRFILEADQVKSATDGLPLQENELFQDWVKSGRITEEMVVAQVQKVETKKAFATWSEAERAPILEQAKKLMDCENRLITEIGLRLRFDRTRELSGRIADRYPLLVAARQLVVDAQEVLKAARPQLEKVDERILINSVLINPKRYSEGFQENSIEEAERVINRFENDLADRIGLVFLEQAPQQAFWHPEADIQQLGELIGTPEPDLINKWRAPFRHYQTIMSRIEEAKAGPQRLKAAATLKDLGDVLDKLTNRVVVWKFSPTDTTNTLAKASSIVNKIENKTNKPMSQEEITQLVSQLPQDYGIQSRVKIMLRAAKGMEIPFDEKNGTEVVNQPKGFSSDRIARLFSSISGMRDNSQKAS